MLRRLQVRASIDGVVVNLQIHTTGGVIQPGATLMGIVPSKDRKIIEARVDPVDIDVVRVGLEARVRLTALPQRHLVPLKGRVVSVSADRFVDEKTGQPYFRVRIILTESPKVNGKEMICRTALISMFLMMEQAIRIRAGFISNAKLPNGIPWCFRTLLRK